MTEFIKTVHLIIVMLLMGGITSMMALSLKAPQGWHKVRYTVLRALLWLLLFTAITGTLLVHPRHFTFHTHWIIAAYILVILCGGLLQYPYSQQRKLTQGVLAYTLKGIWLERILLAVSTLGLVLVIHDAVVKQTLF